MVVFPHPLGPTNCDQLAAFAGKIDVIQDPQASLKPLLLNRCARKGLGQAFHSQVILDSNSRHFIPDKKVGLYLHFSETALPSSEAQSKADPTTCHILRPSPNSPKESSWQRVLAGLHIS